MNNKNILFFDLDGTIIDVSEKYFQTYKYLLKEAGFNWMPKGEYWQYKTQKTSESEILAKTGAQSIWPDYSFNRKNIFETDKFMKFDRLIPDAIDMLSLLKEKYSLVLVSLRHKQDMLLKELNFFDLHKYFDKILSGSSIPKDNWKVKYNLISNYNELNKSNYWMIGDMPTDILAGKQLEMNTVAVLTGLCNQKILEECKPDYILPSIKNLKSIL